MAGVKRGGRPGHPPCQIAARYFCAGVSLVQRSMNPRFNQRKNALATCSWSIESEMRLSLNLHFYCKLPTMAKSETKTQEARALLQTCQYGRRWLKTGNGCSSLESARSRPVIGVQGLTGSFVVDTLSKNEDPPWTDSGSSPEFQ